MMILSQKGCLTGYCRDYEQRWPEFVVTGYSRKEGLSLHSFPKIYKHLQTLNPFECQNLSWRGPAGTQAPAIAYDCM